MIQTLIVDDERNNRQALRSLLDTHCPLINLVGEADSVDAAIDIIRIKKPSLVFLDIQMPTGNGFQLLEKCDPVSFDTIFVTSFDQYAITAIKFSALDYLLKPIDVTELKLAVEKAHLKSQGKGDYRMHYQNLLSNINPGVKDKKIVVHVNSNVLLVPMSQVMYIEADSNYSILHMADGKAHHMAKTLKEIEEFVKDLRGFIRINRSIIMNASFFSHYQKGDPYLAVLRNGLNFEISRRKRPDVLEELKAYMT